MSTIEEDLRFLITELQEERTDTGDELASCPIPGTFGEAWDLFRALCNTRLPKHVSGEFLAKQDKLLHAIIDEEGITYAELIPPMREQFALRRVARGHHHAGGRRHRERREFPTLGMLGAWPLLHRQHHPYVCGRAAAHRVRGNYEGAGS